MPVYGDFGDGYSDERGEEEQLDVEGPAVEMEGGEEGEGGFAGEKLRGKGLQS